MDDVCVGPGPASLRIHRAKARGLELAYFREGAGGLPLVLLHGWPETKRIWWRNVAPLAAAGFAVIAPDLRGFGDSAPAPDDAYDAVTHARDVEALVRGVLGHRRCVVCAGDLGGVIAQDLSLRFEGFVERLILFNTIAPILPGSPSPLTPEVSDPARLLHPYGGGVPRADRAVRRARRRPLPAVGGGGGDESSRSVLLWDLLAGGESGAQRLAGEE